MADSLGQPDDASNSGKAAASDPTAPVIAPIRL
jgi:hypothetical protein